MKNKKGAFTLIELIVAITILSILGIIAFLNYKDYSRDSRNSVRLNDISNIKKVLELFQLNSSFYPDPDETINVTYSGGLLWKQGYFNEGMISKVDRLSKAPKDPLIDVPYTYSLFNRSSKYQIGSMLEGKSTISVISQTYAYTNEDVHAFVTGNFDLYDIHSNTGGTCLNISTPSMIINNLPSDGVLQTSTGYNFVYDEGLLLPKNYEDRMDIVNPGFGFSVYGVYAKCSVEALSDINTYIVNLSSAYNQFNAVSAYNEVANNARTLDFIKKSIGFLVANGITVADNILVSIENAFIDTFSGTNNDVLVGGHFSDTIGTWEFIGTPTNTGSYIIYGNTLQKTSTNEDIITPKLLKAKTSADSTAFVSIDDFNEGNVTLYARYIDENNYYAATLGGNGTLSGPLSGSGGYKITKMISGSGSNLAINNTQAILDGSDVQFEVSSKVGGNDVKLIVNGIELVNNVDNLNPITSIGKDGVKLDRAGIIVDDYTLYFN